jgi:phosphomannomutase
MDTSIFKSYDIRGLSPGQIDESTAYAIGRAYCDEFSLTSVAVGRDARTTSDTLFNALARGIMDAGADVIDIGVVSTPMVYYASTILEVDGVVALTASHNPAEYNGFKLNLAHAVPIGAGTGMERIRDRAVKGEFLPSAKKGTLRTRDVRESYYAHISSQALLQSTTPYTIVADCANGMGVTELPILHSLAPKVTLHTLYDTLDMTFPNHEANPLQVETLSALQKAVHTHSAHLGIAYDGDADRMGFVDELGSVVRMDIITALIAEDILREHPGATILYDLRSSKAVQEHIERHNGIAKECRVGHAHIKRQMRECDALFAGELSGHYYFKDGTLYAECATLSAIRILNVMNRTQKSLSTLVKEIDIYAHSGEINNEVQDSVLVLAKLEEVYADGAVSHLDGLKVVYDDWWFSVRASNTEPLLRLNVEANNPALMAQKRDELLAHIRS